MTRTAAATRATHRAAGDDGPKIPAALTEMSRRELRRWARVYAERDDLIRRAIASGVGVNEIARTMGIAKTTVLRVVHPEACE